MCSVQNLWGIRLRIKMWWTNYIFRDYSRAAGAPFTNMVKLESQHEYVITSIIKRGTELPIPKLQRSNRWSLVVDKWFHLTLCWVCNYISMLWFRLIHGSKRGPWWYQCQIPRHLWSSARSLHGTCLFFRLTPSIILSHESSTTWVLPHPLWP